LTSVPMKQVPLVHEPNSKMKASLWFAVKRKLLGTCSIRAIVSAELNSGTDVRTGGWFCVKSVFVPRKERQDND
jgi:hypothetical protein